MTCEDAARVSDAYVDGELDVERAVDFEAHIAGCGPCAARLEQTRMLSRTLTAAPYLRAPESLAARLRAKTDSSPVATPAPKPAPKPPAARTPFYRSPWFAAVSLAAVLVLVVAAVFSRRGAAADDRTMQAVVEGHVRSLMADHLTDVPSSDRHTVKPWFAGRIDFSPTVVDLASDGFPLIGGRLDYIDQHAAAALIYKRREHVINAFLWPAASGSPSRVTRSDARGYHVIFWTEQGLAVWIVSDLALDELDTFAQKLDDGMRGGR